MKKENCILSEVKIRKNILGKYEKPRNDYMVVRELQERTSVNVSNILLYLLM